MSEKAYNKLMRDVPPFIPPDEELVAVGSFINSAGCLKNMLTFGFAQFKHEVFYVGVTNKRLVVLPINMTLIGAGKVDEDKVFSVDFEDVEVRGNKLIIKTQHYEKLLVLAFSFGNKALSGLDKNEFINAICQRKQLN